MSTITPRFGAHMSVAGGLHNAIKAATQAKCDCLQLFVKNQRRWEAPALTSKQIQDFKAARNGTDLRPVVAHASYLLNLASPDSAQRSKSRAALADELGRCQKLGIEYLVFHPGSRKESSEPQAIRQIAKELDLLADEVPFEGTTVLLETTAGQGTSVGHRFDQLSAIIDTVEDGSRFAVCLDTCHVFVAGYDFRQVDGYQEMMAEFDSTVGIDRLKCIHVNDSKGDTGSRLDRHEHIGDGKIGYEGFAHFVNDPRLLDVPMILETPKDTDDFGVDMDEVNLNRLRSLRR